MKSIGKLKEQARLHEQKEEWEKAIQVYQRALSATDEAEGEVDLSIYNRIGDLYIRLGRQLEAVGFYEQAADRYAEAGLYNNAIALCNKALRYSPQRADLYRKLGQLSAAQGFFTDAHRWFVEYAERKIRAGDRSEALAALEEFADLADDPEIREELAQQLVALGEAEAAGRQLRQAYGLRLRAGQVEEARATRSRLLTLEPRADLSGVESEAVEGAPPPAPAPRRGGARKEDLPGLEIQTAAGSAGIDAAPAEPTAAGAALEIEPTVLEALPLEVEDLEVAEPLPLLGDHIDDGAPIDVADPDPVESLPLVDAPGDAAAFDPRDFLAPRAAPGPEAAVVEEVPAPRSGSRDPAPARDGFVDLASLLQNEDDADPDTRFVVEAKPPTGDEDQDFLDVLGQFKAKVAEHVGVEDATSHYDLGLAFKEMGLVDEAIAEFQVALRAGNNRLKVYEELGHCFMLKQQYNIAAKILGRALQLSTRDDAELLGVYYQLARSYEELGQVAEARDAYERVIALDINFRDASERLGRL